MVKHRLATSLHIFQSVLLWARTQNLGKVSILPSGIGQGEEGA